LEAVWGWKWPMKICLCAGLIGIGLVTFLSLRSSPAVSTVKWMPRIVAHWADRHGRFCNFPAYGLLAVPFLMIASTIRRQAWVVAMLAALIFLLEIAQLAVPTRFCDIGDMACGWAGLLVAWIICVALKKFVLVIKLKSTFPR
jgi:glycopeptide antibiotics resistance protein